MDIELSGKTIRQLAKILGTNNRTTYLYIRNYTEMSNSFFGKLFSFAQQNNVVLPKRNEGNLFTLRLTEALYNYDSYKNITFKDLI